MSFNRLDSTEKEYIFNCDICTQEYKHGFGVYQGHKLELYGNVFCCEHCWNSNWDGWGPGFEGKLLSILKVRNLTIPSRNKKGWLPRD